MEVKERCKCCCHQAALLVSGIVFALMAIVHLLRILLGWTWICNGHEMPLWTSIIGLIVLALLAIWDLRAYWCIKCRKNICAAPPSNLV